MKLQCFWCKKIFYRRKNRNKKSFCNKECEWFWRKNSPCPIPRFARARKEKNSRWKGGRRSNGQYIYVRAEGHPKAFSKGHYVAEHTFVAEKILGRFLVDEEVIHHINEIKTDNRPENLYLFQSKSEHAKYHRLIQLKRIKRIKVSNLPIIKNVVKH